MSEERDCTCTQSLFDLTAYFQTMRDQARIASPLGIGGGEEAERPGSVSLLYGCMYKKNNMTKMVNKGGKKKQQASKQVRKQTNE